jgi:tetratricopeptide (TPR) repeat protein
MMKSDDTAGFYGPRSTSPDGKFTLAWFDGDQSSGRGGSRESGDGQYALLEGSRVILRGRLQRPNDGHVANNGSFVLNDWMFGEGLKGTFYAFGKSGQILLRKVFRANLLNCGISSDGMYAICQTCNSDNEDSHKLSLFDLVKAELLFCVEPPRDRWAETYEFDSANQKVYLGCGDWGRFAFSFSGEFLDQDRWEDERIKRATGAQLARIARDRWKRDETRENPERIGATLLLMHEALNRGMAGYPAEIARVHRDIGEGYESLGQNDKALEHFRISISIDPSAGVKRAIDRLSSTSGPPVTAMCPYCLGGLPRAPKRKSKCPNCGKSIFVKNRPGSSEVVLVTEDDAKKIDEEWEWSRKTSTWLRILERYGLSDEEFQLRRKRNQQAYGSKASDRDIFWGFLNELVPKTVNEWELSNVYNMMAMFLHEEHKDFLAQLQESKRWVLRALKAGGCLNVRISASEHACEACRRQDGKVLTIDEAIALLPVPCSECQSVSPGAKRGFCRCRYVSLEGTVLERGSVEIKVGPFPAVIGYEMRIQGGTRHLPSTKHIP